MIYFGFNITNPWSHRWDTIFYKDKLFANKKGGEIQVVKDNTIVGFSFRLATRCDHAGVSLDIGLFGYTAMFNFYDTRHWNTEAGRYFVYDDAGNAS